MTDTHTYIHTYIHTRLIPYLKAQEFLCENLLGIHSHVNCFRTHLAVRDSRRFLAEPRNRSIDVCAIQCYGSQTVCLFKALRFNYKSASIDRSGYPKANEQYHREQSVDELVPGGDAEFGKQVDLAIARRRVRRRTLGDRCRRRGAATHRSGGGDGRCFPAWRW